MPADVRPAGPDDAAAAGRSLARAFRDDPVFQWFVPGVERDPRADRLTRFWVATTRMHLPLGGAWTAADRSGAALWVPPGQKIPMRRQLPALAQFTLATRHRAPRGARAMSVMEKHHPKDPPHWYLAVLGTDPNHQGKGIGGALLAPVLDRCDAEGVPAYLESSKESNIPFYERFGFTVQGELLLAPGGPVLWPMWRDPK